MNNYGIIMAYLSVAALSMCSTTKHIQQSHAKPAVHKSKTTLVDANWLDKYKASEDKYGYHIAQDAQIKAVGGKYRVPQEVIDHQLDMSKAKPQ